jgi:hypothetical protein
MSPDRERRYQSAADLAADLRACLEGRAPIRSHAARPTGAAPVSRPLVAERADRFVAIGLISGTVVVLDAASGAQLAVIPGDGTALERLAFHDDGRLVIDRANGRVDLVEISEVTSGRLHPG